MNYKDTRVSLCKYSFIFQKTQAKSSTLASRKQRHCIFTAILQKFNEVRGFGRLHMPRLPIASVVQQVEVELHLQAVEPLPGVIPLS